MARKTVIEVLQRIERPVFTTRETALLQSGGLSSSSQSLSCLARKGVVRKIIRGVWCRPGDPFFSPFAVVPFLTPGQRAYVSFLSALHLRGVIEQIPQVIYAATTGHGRVVRTPVGTYSFHRIHPRFFVGFDWYGDRNDFLVATAEKALVDCLYLSGRRGKSFGSFPELHLGKPFSFPRAFKWVARIPDARIRGYVSKRLKGIRMLGSDLHNPLVVSK